LTKYKAATLCHVVYHHYSMLKVQFDDGAAGSLSSACYSNWCVLADPQMF